MTGFDVFGAEEAALKPLARRAGEYGRVYGDGIRDGRGYGPYGAGYSKDGRPLGPDGSKLSREYDYTAMVAPCRWSPPKRYLPGFGSDTAVGFDLMSLAKVGTGLLSGAGGMLTGGLLSGGGQAAPAGQTAPAQGSFGMTQAQQQQAAYERARLEEDRRKAEQSASNTKIALGVAGGALVAALGIAALRRR